MADRARTVSAGHGSAGQQFGSGSGWVTAFWPGFLFNVAVDIIEQDGSVTVHSAHSAKLGQ